MTRPSSPFDLERVRTDPDPRLRVVEPVTWGTIAVVVLVTLVGGLIGGAALVWLVCRCRG